MMPTHQQVSFFCCDLLAGFIADKVNVVNKSNAVKVENFIMCVISPLTPEGRKERS